MHRQDWLCFGNLSLPLEKGARHSCLARGTLFFQRAAEPVSTIPRFRWLSAGFFYPLAFLPRILPQIAPGGRLCLRRNLSFGRRQAVSRQLLQWATWSVEGTSHGGGRTMLKNVPKPL